MQFDCDGCGAHLEFDADEQAMKCPYCGTMVRVERVKDPIVEHRLDEVPSRTGWERKATTIKCESCGATTVLGVELADECAFCDSPMIKRLPQHEDIITPENLVPFRIDHDEARTLYFHWIGRGFFRPGNLKKVARLDKLKGIYTPFWTYDCHTYSEWTATSGDYYYETESYTTWENGERVSKTRRVRKVRWYPSSGSRKGFYDDQLIVASKGIDYHLMFEIYPFHLDGLVTYKPEYLSGWLAEEYSIGVRQGWYIAKDNVKKDEYKRCGNDVPGDTYRNLNVNTKFSDITYKHILLPIWTASYIYKGKLYHFLINGQTGELHGYKPISWAKVAAVAITAAVSVIGIIKHFWL